MEDAIEHDLFRALWKLLSVKDIDDVSVCEIVAAAHCGRSSFYHRFKDKYVLLWRTLQAATRQSGFMSASVPLSEESVLLFLRAAAKASTCFRHAFSSSDQEAPRAKCVSLCLAKTLWHLKSCGVDIGDERVRVRCSIYAYEVVGVFVAWLDGAVSASAEDLLGVCSNDLVRLREGMAETSCASRYEHR